MLIEMWNGTHGKRLSITDSLKHLFEFKSLFLKHFTDVRIVHFIVISGYALRPVSCFLSVSPFCHVFGYFFIVRVDQRF